MSSSKKKVSGSRVVVIPRGRGRPVSTSVKDYVKQELHREIENKDSPVSSTAFSVYNYLNNTTNFGVNNLFALTPYDGTLGPSITQSGGQAGRIGNKIRPVKNIFNMYLFNAGYDATTNPNPEPQMLRFIVFSPRGCQTVAEIRTSFGADFFQLGDTSGAMLGNTNDLMKKVNQDKYIVYKDWTQRIGFSTSTAAGGVMYGLSYNNNDFPLVYKRKLDITKYTPKVIHFNDNTAIPTAKSLWMVVIAVNHGNVAAYAVDKFQLRMTYQHDFQYEDA